MAKLALKSDYELPNGDTLRDYAQRTIDYIRDDLYDWVFTGEEDLTDEEERKQILAIANEIIKILE